VSNHALQQKTVADTFTAYMTGIQINLLFILSPYILLHGNYCYISDILGHFRAIYSRRNCYHTTDSSATLDSKIEDGCAFETLMLECRQIRADRRRIVPIRAMTSNGMLLEDPDGETWVYGTTQKLSNGRRSGRGPSPPRRRGEGEFAQT